MTLSSRSRERARRGAFSWLILGLLVGCSATSIDKPSATGGSHAGGSATSSGSPSFGGELTMANDLHRQCSDDSWGCKQKVDCPADSSPSTTSVSGVVYDPAGRVPLYNAVVYVADPDTQLKPLGQGAQCEECKAHFPASATAVTLTKADGSFRLTDMPVGKEVPLIIQLGKWRRIVKIPLVTPCTDTRLPADLTRLPRNSSEGDLPKIAITTGGSDALECLLKKIGVDTEEFTPDSGKGRVNLFAGFGAAKSMTSGGATLPLRPAEELWADSDRMLDYDMLLLSCEGNDNLWNPPSDKKFPPGAIERPQTMALEVRKYADLGGRIFGSHWHHRWIGSDDSTPDYPYPQVANFSKTAKDIGDVKVSVDATFPKGAAFQAWLMAVGASTTPGELSVGKAEHSVDSVVPSLARSWIFGTDLSAAADDREPAMVQYFSFTTPVSKPECGRMVFSDVHVSFGGGTLALEPFPQRCDTTLNSELTPQEKALEFMIFDLSSCIQKEDDEVSSPITVVK